MPLPASQGRGEENDAGDDSRPAGGYTCVAQCIGFEVYGRGRAPEQDAEHDEHNPRDPFAGSLAMS